MYYIKSLAEKPLEIKVQKMPAADGSGGEGIIEVPEPVPFDAAARARALALYKDACASCHGNTGRGDGAQEQKDEEGFPTRPRDLTAGVFKGNPDPIALYRHIVAGIPGSPMPMSDWAYGADAWHLVNYVRSLSSDTQRRRVEMKKFTIEAVRVKTLPRSSRVRHLAQRAAGQSSPDAAMVAERQTGASDGTSLTRWQRGRYSYGLAR